MKFQTSTSFFIILFLSYGVTFLQTGTAQEAQNPAATAAVQQALPAEFAELLPEGQLFKGVEIPNFDGDILKSIVQATTMKRADSEHLEMTDLVITMIDPEQGDTRIRMRKAIYDMTEQKLMSRTPGIIEQPTFDMYGDQMTLEGASNRGHVVGNVKMIIHDVSSLQPKDEESEEKED